VADSASARVHASHSKGGEIGIIEWGCLVIQITTQKWNHPCTFLPRVCSHERG